MLPASLVDMLVCPKSKLPLVYFPRGEDDRDEADGFFLCPASRLRYPIHDGVPALLVEEAVAVTASTVDQLLARARQLGLPLAAAPAGHSA